MSVKIEAAEFLAESAKLNGVACATTSDGHVLIFTREKLQELIDKSQEKNMVIVFVKRPDFKN